MKNPIKLLFVYDLLPEHDPHWRDGLSSALKELEKEWEVDYWNISKFGSKPKIEELGYDFYLGWGGSTSEVAQLPLDGLCFGGGDFNDPILDKFKVVFVENTLQMVKPHFRHAFGTNTDLFYEMSMPKMFDAIYPAAFANWKEQNIFADICEREHLKGLAVGYKQVDNQEESIHLMNYCLVKGVAVMDWVPAKALVYLYNMSKEVIITANPAGGSERAILEAKACNVPVRVVSESAKLHVLNELTHEEVLKEWNHIKYAEKLKEGINEVLNSR